MDLFHRMEEVLWTYFHRMEEVSVFFEDGGGLTYIVKNHKKK